MSATKPSHPEYPQNSPLLDIEQLETLIVLGAADYHDLFGDVTGSVPDRIQRIGAAIQAGNAKQLRADAHELRGMLLYFGCEAMTRRLNLLELPPSPATAEAGAIQEQLLELWQQSLAAIQQWQQSVPELAP